jgi:8-oxo-dGTP diphosphatase
MQGINTTLCYIEKNGKYLMLHRVKKKNDLNQDKWIGIGGKFEDKESPEDCILRETQEETGLTLTHLEYRGLVTFISDRFQTEYMHLFWADAFTGELKECDEGNLEWIAKEDLMQLPMWEGDEIFLKLLEERAPFFSLKLSYVGDTLTEAVLNGQLLPVRTDLEQSHPGDTHKTAEHSAQ